MQSTTTLSLSLALPLALAACSPLQAQPAATPAAAVSVYRSLGSLQCSGGGTPVAALRAQLEQAGVRVLGESCGSDGRMRAAMCGRGDGLIAIFEVAAVDQAAALGAGFEPLAGLPDAVRRPCPQTTP